MIDKLKYINYLYFNSITIRLLLKYPSNALLDCVGVWSWQVYAFISKFTATSIKFERIAGCLGTVFSNNDSTRLLCYDEIGS